MKYRVRKSEDFHFFILLRFDNHRIQDEQDHCILNDIHRVKRPMKIIVFPISRSFFRQKKNLLDALRFYYLL
jgi:hypothetical protein